ncbi:MAG TPA: DUF1707 domain-containing protein [Streptosporangiaceae bacterium]|jgi:hypothetical protein
MDDRMRASDADREALTARLRDHYAEGRLTQDELDERVSAALGAKTFGELRTLTTDLPGPVPAPPRTVARPTWDGPPPWQRHRHHRPPVGLFLLIALLLVLSSGGGWAVFGFFRLLLVFWLAMMATRIVIGLVYRRRHR